MLTISNLDFQVEARPLFESATAQISSGWKVGLVGRNGTGKSTLLRLIREDVENPRNDSAIRLNTGARLGWVAQEVEASDETILDVVLAADTERHALMQESETATDPDRIGEIHERLLDIDAWTAEARAAEVLNGLGFTTADLGRATKEFSGGWRMRAAIAGVLFSQPDFLLLDEPTNYLDLEGAAWLETYIKKYPYTVLIVSHDRELLNRCVTHTMALEHRKLSITPGGYDDWLKLRAAKLAQLESQKAKQDKDREHLQAFVDRFRPKASKARQAQSRIKMLEKMQDISIPVGDRTTPFHFAPPKDKLAPPMLELRNATLGYGEDAIILDKVNLRLDPDDRIAIVGANGQGKTTLVKSIGERLSLIGGDRVVPKAVRIGYFSQDILILDEPTSHLDIDSREALIYALNEFPGAVLLITHDVYLAEATADRLWLVNNGRAAPYDGDLADYRALVMKADRDDTKGAKPAKQAKPAAPKEISPEEKKRLTALKKTARDAEDRLEKANAAIAKIDAKLAHGNPPPSELEKLLKDRATHAAKADTAETEWMEAAEALEIASVSDTAS